VEVEKTMAKGQKPSFIIWVTIIGVFVSLLLAIVPIFFTPNISLSLLIALVGIAATYLVDVGIKVKENGDLFSSRTGNLQSEIEKLVESEGDDIKRAIKLGEYLARDDELRKTIESIVDTCEKVKRLNVDVFNRKIDEYLTDCNELIDKLSDGEEVLKSNFSFLPSVYSLHKSMARIVMSTEPLYLDSVYGRKMIEQQKRCIELNRKITFIWVQERDILEHQKFRTLVAEQKSKKVDVYIVEKESVPSKLWKDFGIVDNRYFYLSSFDNGKPDSDDVSTNQSKLRELEDDFDRLFGLAEAIDVYYAQPGQAVS
jgi:hypothetical protein